MVDSIPPPNRDQPAQKSLCNMGLNSIIAINVWAADQVKNREIIEDVWEILLGDGSQKREVSGQNGRVGISAFG